MFSDFGDCYRIYRVCELVLLPFFFFFLLSMLCPLWTRDMDVYATLQKSRLCPHYKRNCTLRTTSLHNFGCKGVFLLTAREASKLIDCQLTANATRGLIHIHNCFCFLHTCRTLLLLPIFGFLFQFQASTSGICNFLPSKKDTCAFPPHQAKETGFWKETG